MTKTKKMIIWVPLVLVVMSIGGYELRRSRSVKQQAFHEDQVKRSDFIETILSTGAVAPENRLDIKPPVAGRMDELLVVEGQAVKKGQVLAWVSSTERAAMLDSARAEGEASLKQWETYYKATPIYAPIDGVIILQNIWPGQSFATTDAILTMSDRLTVKAQVDETDISKVKLGQKALITLDAYPGENIDAKVVHVAFDSKTVNSVTTYIVDVLPIKVPHHMLSGMTANVTFILNSVPHSLQIPNEALQSENDTLCVKIKSEREGDSPICKKVELGPSTDGYTVVRSGLTEGQTILIPDLKPIPQKNQDASSKNPLMGGRGHH